MDDNQALPADLVKRAKEELGETPKRLRDVLDTLRARIAALPPHDRLEDVSDANLVRFVRGRKYRIERALETSITLARFNSSYPEFTARLSASEFSAIAPAFRVLPEPDVNGRVVVVLRPPIAVPGLKKLGSVAMVRVCVWFFDCLSRIPRAQVCGVTILHSFAGITLADQRWLGTRPMRYNIAVMQYMNTCVALRLSTYLCFDLPLPLRPLFYMCTALLSSKLRARCQLCGGDLQRARRLLAEPEVLPKCLGGSAPEPLTGPEPLPKGLGCFGRRVFACCYSQPRV